MSLRIRKETKEILDEADAEKRVKRFAALKPFLDAEAKRGSDAAEDFQIALEPVFKYKIDLKSPDGCEAAYTGIIYNFEGGSGFNGILPKFVHDCLDLLAAVCKDPSLREFSLPREDE